MKFYSYIIPRDFGFAPNPYFNYCTLATCKPNIRRDAQVGDWIGAFGSKVQGFEGKLVVLMLVEEILTFDQYWTDSRFIDKRPVFNKSTMYMYGDNIYHHVNGKWVQEFSHHSKEDGKINYINLNRDTKVDRVLIASEFYYFGSNAIDVPEEFRPLIWQHIGNKTFHNEVIAERFIEFVCQNYNKGIYGIPYSRQNGKFIYYGGN